MYNPDYSISNKLLNIVTQIEAVRSKIELSHILPEREVAMRYRATVEATHSSTSIEGNPLTFKQVERVLSGSPALTRHQYAQIEVRNYKKALDYTDKRGASGKKMTLEDVLHVHGIITSELLDSSRTGNWRKNPVYIDDGEGHTVYDAAPPEVVRKEVAQLLAWLNSNSYDIHPVIAAAIFHIQFVSIHPFADGNGRSTRVLTILYLSLRNYDFRHALVLDSFYSTNKLEYYKALHSTQGKDYQCAKSTNLDSWIEYFAEGFLVSANVLAAEVTLLSSAVQNISNTQKLARDDADILSYVQQFGVITVSEAEDILHGTPRRSVQRKLKGLVDAGYLQVDGASRSTRYRAVQQNDFRNEQ